METPTTENLVAPNPNLRPGKVSKIAPVLAYTYEKEYSCPNCGAKVWSGGPPHKAEFPLTCWCGKLVHEDQVPKVDLLGKR